MMPRRFAALLGLLCSASAVAPTHGRPIPQLIKQGTHYRLLVDGKPFLMLGAQVDNITFVPQEMAKALPGFRSYNANTVEFPVTWKLIEPREGRFEFAAFDQVVRDVRARGLHAVVLWFGTWKGDEAQFLPDWVKADRARFPMALAADGNATKSLSPHGSATLDADRKAFKALMTNLRRIDANERTVIMVQVENEPGIVGSARDHSAEADRLFRAPVPAEFVTALKLNPGTWTETFGRRFAEEAFTSYSMAKFIDAVAAAGKSAYPLPMYVNVWLGGAGTSDRFYDFDGPGDSYPSGGGQSHTLALWKAAAPAIDFIAPDIYHRSAVIYRTVLSRYARPDNPLMIVETGRGLEFARFCFMAVGEFGSLGFAQFGAGIKLFGATADGEFGPGFIDMAANYRLLANAAPVIAKLQGTGRLQSAIEEENIPGRMLSFDRWDVQAIFPPALSKRPTWMDPVGPPPIPSGRVLLAQLRPDEFLILGFDTTVDFRPSVTSGHREGRFAQIEQGLYKNGNWTATKSLPAAAPARGLALPREGAMVRVKLEWN